MILSGLLFLLVILVNIFAVGVSIYGIIHSFKKAWYIGLASLVFPIFGFVVGLAKLFKKDILK